VVLTEGDGAWVRDTDGRMYLDMLSAYSALNFGHRHPEIVAAAEQQLRRLTLTSRAFFNDQLGPFCAELAHLIGMEVILPMNTGAEAVETAIKAARKWSYERKGVLDGRAQVIVCEGNFHGRTTTIVGFSSDQAARGGFGPFAPGFRTIPYGDVDALEDAIEDDTAAFLVEPIQGERGVVVPPSDYLPRVRRLCTDNGVLLILDEIQSGLGRTGATLDCDHAGIRPDLLTLGKALGGGVVPLSAVAGRREVMEVFTPGTHGSTFGGNPLACAVGRAVIRLLAGGDIQERAARLGSRMLDRLRAELSSGGMRVRGRGLWTGIDLDTDDRSAREICEALLGRGMLCKETHERTVRIAPPLTVHESDLDWALDELIAELA
jgi:ornithine--oxo-acid transaminase